MGRFVDLCGEIAAEADEGPEGLLLGREAWQRLRGHWEETDIEDALSVVKDSLLQSELVEAADSLSARMVEILGALGEAGAFQQAEAGGTQFTLEQIAQVARRVDRLEEVLAIYREGQPPDRSGFDALRIRLMDVGIEEEMQHQRLAGELEGRSEDEE